MNHRLWILFLVDDVNKEQSHEKETAEAVVQNFANFIGKHLC